MKRIVIVLMFLKLFCLAQHEVLIVTGQSNHSWKNAAPILKTIFDQSELFNATVIESPEKGNSMINFQPEFSAFDAVVIIYNGDSWSNSTQMKLEYYIENIVISQVIPCLLIRH